MTTVARLLTTRLLVEAEPEPEQTPEPPPPTPPAPEADKFSARDWILQQANTHHGTPQPDYYNELADKLGNRNKKKLDGSTYLLRHEDGSISIRFHATDIITARPDGTVVISTYGTPNPKQMHVRQRFGYVQPGYGEAARSWRTPITRNRINDHLPCNWSLYAHGKSSLPSATSMIGDKRGDQNWWWCNSQSRSGLWNGQGYRIPFSDFDQIDTKSGDLKSKLSPVPMKGRGSNPERTSGYGFDDRFYEAKKLAPNWTETGGIFADLSAFPTVDYYAKCPKCGQCHGSYKTMREAHSKRLCQRCDLESIEKIKQVVAHVDDPGMTPKSISRIVGEAEEFDARDYVLNFGDWFQQAKGELETVEDTVLDFVDPNILDYDPETLNQFDVEESGSTHGRRYTVFKNEEAAEAYAIERVSQDIDDQPEVFAQDWLVGFLDKDKLKRTLQPDDTQLEHEEVTEQVRVLVDYDFLKEEQFYTASGKFRKITQKLQNLIDSALYAYKESEHEAFDPVAYLKEIYGEYDWIKEAFELAPLSRNARAKAAAAAVQTDGWTHFIAHYDNKSIDLDSGAVAARIH